MQQDYGERGQYRLPAMNPLGILEDLIGEIGQRPLEEPHQQPRHEDDIQPDHPGPVFELLQPVIFSRTRRPLPQAQAETDILPGILQILPGEEDICHVAPGQEVIHKVDISIADKGDGRQAMDQATVVGAAHERHQPVGVGAVRVFDSKTAHRQCDEGERQYNMLNTLAGRQMPDVGLRRR